MFSKHHYLDHALNKSSHCYGAFVDGKLVGFSAVCHFPHPKEKRFKRAHRTVVLPDYQGIGIAKVMINTIAQHYLDQGYRFISTTTNPQVVQSRSKDPAWNITKIGKAGFSKTYMAYKTASWDRMTVSFEYLGEKKPLAVKARGIN